MDNLTKLLKSFILLILIFVFFNNSYAIEQIEFDSDSDTSYLPYKSVIAREGFSPGNHYLQVDRILRVIKPSIKGISEGLLTIANNPIPNSNNNPMISPKSFPEFVVTDDDPIRYNIAAWDKYINKSDSAIFIVGLCNNKDSLFAFKLYLDTDSIEYKNIYVREHAKNKELVTNSRIVYIGDFDRDGSIEILAYVAQRTFIRRLFCFDFITLEIKWEREISSGVSGDPLIDWNDEIKETRIIFTTGNPANGAKDSNYNDRFSYITILDKFGDILLNDTLSLYGRESPRLINTENSSEYYLTHYLKIGSTDSTDNKKHNEYYLTKLDSYGKVINQINIMATPNYLWLSKYKDFPDTKLFVRFRNKEIHIFNADLSMFGKIPTLETPFNYYGSYKIFGFDDSVFVFGDGIYDRELNKLLHFPFSCGTFEPIEYDSLGNLSAYVITYGLHYYIGYVVKKTKTELISVFYHQNQKYVLMLLSGLLVGLLLINYYRYKSKTNYLLISKQKRELETIHEALRKAQVTIVAHEKFRQAKDIAGGFAHEIRNDLFPARSGLNKIITADDVKLKDLNWIKRVCQFSDEAVRRAVELTQQISNYSSIESSKKVESVDLIEILNEVIDSVRFSLEENAIELSLVEFGNQNVAGNREQYYIILNNLILNAIDALNDTDRPKIEINLESQKNKVILTISDNGCGIPKENIKRIFDFFYSTKPTSGTGLGLAMVKKIIELYTGSIEVNSFVSQGTTFKLRFNKYKVDK